MDIEIKASNNEEIPDRRDELIARITLAHGVYFLVVVIAAVLRFADLGLVPLSPIEATEALATWDFWQPDSSPGIIYSPIYFTATAILTQLLGFKDGVMRLVPAIFGIGLVILPWFLRHRIGTLGAIVAGLMFAISPSLTVVSRTAGGQSAALFAGLLCFIAWMRYQESGNDRWFYTLAVSLAIGLISAPIFYGIFLLFALAWITQMLVGPYLLSEDEDQRLPTRWPDRHTIRDSVLIMAGVIALGATAFLFLPGGIGVTADIVAAWLGRILNLVTAQVWLSPFLAIGRYEITLIILGIPAVIWATRNDSRFPIFLVYAICWTILLILLQPGEMSNLLVLTLPGYLLIGNFTGQILGKIPTWSDVAVMMIVLVAGGIIVANLVRYGRLTAIQTSIAGSYHLMLALTVLVLVTIAITVIWSWNEQSVSTGITAGMLLLSLILMWGNSWYFSRDGRNDTRELWSEVATDGDIRLLAENVKEISWKVTNSGEDLDIKSTVDNPNLRWYLRDMVNLEIVSTVSNSDFDEALLTPGSDSPALKNDYIGSDFSYLRTETSHVLDTRQILSWWLFRESPVPINREQLVLWLRADLAGGTL